MGAFETMSRDNNNGKILELSPEKCYTRYLYEDITIGNRNSLKEHQQDIGVTSKFWNIHTGDIILDIGAGFGAYTLIALARGAHFVFCFERDREVAAALRSNIQINKLLLASERTAVSTWSLDDNIKSIDKYLSELSYPITRLDWLKIHLDSVADTRNVLYGAKQTIQRYAPNILTADIEPPPLPRAYAHWTLPNDSNLGHTLLVPVR